MTRPGLALERTVIAWARTAIGAAGFGAVLLRLGFRSGAASQVASAIAALVCAAQLAGAARTAYRRRGRAPRTGALRLVTIEVVALGVLTAFSAFV